jgi:hypothetical protein
VLPGTEHEHLAIATAAHVIADSSEIHVLHEDRLDTEGVFRSVFPDVKVLAVDFDRDIAILDVPHIPKGTLRALELDPDRCGSAKRGWGYPETAFGSTGELGLAFKDLNPQQEIKLPAEERFGPERRELAKDKVRGLVFSPHLADGNSGGPLLSADKKVVAVAALRSNVEDQGAGVCISEVVALSRLIKPQPITRESIKELLTDVLGVYLSSADKPGSAKTIRDYVPPSVIAEARSAFQGVLVGATLSSGSIYDTSAVFEQAFPGSLTNIATRGSICQKSSEEALECWTDLTTRPVALSLLRYKVGSTTSVHDIEVLDDPKEVSKDPPEYAVIAKWLDADLKPATATIRVRNEWGRLWVVPDNVETVWGATQKLWNDAGGKFDGRWKYSKPDCNGTYELRLSHKDKEMSAEATVSMTSDGCNVLISSEYHVERTNDHLSLRLIPGKVQAQSRCNWGDDVKLELELRKDGRLHCLAVDGRKNYGFCGPGTVESLVFERTAP